MHRILRRLVEEPAESEEEGGDDDEEEEEEEEEEEGHMDRELEDEEGDHIVEEDIRYNHSFLCDILQQRKLSLLKTVLGAWRD